MSSVSNGLYFLTLPLASCALSIRQKECRKSLGCALYIRCALYIEKYGTSKSNRILLPLLKTTQSKFKQNDNFLQSILLLYFCIALCNTKGKKTKISWHKILQQFSFCQIWEENNVWMLHNMTPLKTDITELSVNKRKRCIHVNPECYFFKKKSKSEVSFVSQV